MLQIWNYKKVLKILKRAMTNNYYCDTSISNRNIGTVKTKVEGLTCKFMEYLSERKNLKYITGQLEYSGLREGHLITNIEFKTSGSLLGNKVDSKRKEKIDKTMDAIESNIELLIKIFPKVLKELCYYEKVLELLKEIRHIRKMRNEVNRIHCLDLLEEFRSDLRYSELKISGALIHLLNLIKLDKESISRGCADVYIVLTCSSKPSTSKNTVFVSHD